MDWVLPGSMREFSLVDLVGVAVALALVAASRLFLPAEEKKRVFLPAAFLAAALVFAGLRAVATDDRLFHFLYAFFLLASCGRSLVLLAVDVVFGRRIHRAPPRIFRDLTQAVVYVAVLMLTFRTIGVEPGSLLTTSALLTAVIGLSLQDTLGNLVSGLALQMQRPFEVGDWIQFDPDARQIGQVTEVNWRATTVRTSDLVEVIVPNATLAKQPIRNFSRPSPVSRRTVVVQGAYEISPKRVHDAIEAALVGTPGVLADPPPFVQTRSFADSGVEYAVFFFTNDFASRDRTDGYVRDRIWYAMQRSGISIPFPIRTVHMHAVSEETVKKGEDLEIQRRDRVLRCVDFLDVLPTETHQKLAASVSVRVYAPGEIVVAQGDQSTELFVIDRGEVSVELLRNDRALPVARLGPGKFFGEMSLMTGEPRKATVRAVEECELFVIGHDAFHEALASEPGLVERMSELLSTRQAELDAAESARSPTLIPDRDESRRLISQIKDFFKL